MLGAGHHCSQPQSYSFSKLWNRNATHTQIQYTIDLCQVHTQQNTKYPSLYVTWNRNATHTQIQYTIDLCIHFRNFRIFKYLSLVIFPELAQHFSLNISPRISDWPKNADVIDQRTMAVILYSNPISIKHHPYCFSSIHHISNITSLYFFMNLKSIIKLVTSDLYRSLHSQLAPRLDLSITLSAYLSHNI